MHDTFYKELQAKFDFDINNITYQKNYGRYIIDIPSSKKIVTKVNLSPARILFIHGAKQHLYNNGFQNIDTYICSNTGEPYVIIQGSYYTLTDFIDGKHCDFNDKAQLTDAVINLALLHKSSQGYIPPENSFPCNNLGMLPSLLDKRLSEIKKIKKIAQKHNGEFDSLVLRYIDHFYSLGKDAVNLLKKSNYHQLVEETARRGNFCHNDYSHNNIIYQKNAISITNFALCSFELRTYDLVNLIRRKMRKCNWYIHETKYIIDNYCSIESLTKDELFLIKIMIKFPQKFWRIINRYYNSRHGWSEDYYCIKLQETIDELTPIETFIKEFDQLLL